MKRREVTFILVALILCAVCGGLIGDVIACFLPPGAAKTVFGKSIEIGMETMRVDFYAVAFTFGLKLKVNFMSVLVLLLVIIYFRWWYL